MPHVARSLGAAALAGYVTLQVLGRTAGSTRSERAAWRPGDDLVDHPQLVTNHAITVDAPADQVWPWLTQMGWHLGGYYTPEWVDRYLFPANWSSLDHLDPALVRDLQPGDVIPDGAPGTAQYVVHQATPPHLLVLRSTHAPAAGVGHALRDDLRLDVVLPPDRPPWRSVRGSTCGSAVGAPRGGSRPCTSAHWSRPTS